MVNECMAVRLTPLCFKEFESAHKIEFFYSHMCKSQGVASLKFKVRTCGTG